MPDTTITELLRPDGHLAVAGRGVAVAPGLDAVPRRRVPSVYADPLAWLVLDAVEQAIDDCADNLAAVKDSVGHIAVSDYCTTHTMLGIAATVADGHISPLRFSGANPGAVAGLSCQLLALCGPSTTLSMPPYAGLPTAVALARMWLRQGAAEYMIISTHHTGDQGHHTISSTVLGPRDRSEPT
ncbi:hypothetical protein [Nocardia sp. BMG51109]|uniref:hypothetical protein n=1 Tax=Nocardia sp. BMG51109 TaxID=1056816 RepID=UPI0004638E59|nr:hypothetical protein [Nocardia sp. BMG51109]